MLMQGLGRFAQHTESEGSPGPPSSGVALIENTMYQAIPTSEYFDGMAYEEPRCLSTRGTIFNFLVGLVVCANAILMGVEADLGLLGPAGPTWTGLQADLQSVHAVPGVGHGIESEIKNGITGDQILKDNLQEKLNETLHKDVAINDVLALPAGSGQLRFAAYTICEYFFVAFFLCEMLLRLCDLGCRNYLCRYAWTPLDMAVVTTGLMDLSLPFILDAEVERMSVLPFLRLLRVLRLLKLFQVCQPLRIVGRGVIKAFAVVMLVGMVVLVLNFGLSIILTTLIGQRGVLLADEQGAEVVEWFGSIGRSMQTLFTIQTLAGWDHIATTLSTIYPSSIVVPMVVLYMMICCFAVVGLITSVISDSFMASQQREQKSKEAARDARRHAAAMELGKLFTEHGRSFPGFINRKELEAAVQEAFVTQVLNSMEVPANKTDILKLFDKMNKEASFAGRVQAEHMAEAVTSIAGGWRVSGFFDVKHQVLGVKNDVMMKSELAAKEAADQRRELQDLDKKTKHLAIEVQKEVKGIHDELAVVKAQISKVLVKMEEQAKWLEQEKKERSTTFADVQEKLSTLPTQAAVLSGISSKVELLEKQVVSQSSLGGKMDALTVQVATQAMVGAKVEALLGQVSAQLISLNSDKKLDDKFNFTEGHDLLKPCEPAAEPESSFPSAAASACKEDDLLDMAAAPAGGSGEPWAAAFGAPEAAAEAQSWATFPESHPEGQETKPPEES